MPSTLNSSLIPNVLLSQQLVHLHLLSSIQGRFVVFGFLFVLLFTFCIFLLFHEEREMNYLLPTLYYKHMIPMFLAKIFLNYYSSQKL